jgi:glycosyltransferase involved in cell wall biosynthesis
MPEVSVVIPTFQHARFVGQAIDSVLAQTYRDYEIIVVDDGSTDDTQAVLAGYRALITPIYQENRGLSAARNAGIRASSGKYIAFLDADDLWLPEKLERQAPLFEQDASVGLVCSDMSYFDQDGDRPGTAFGMKDRPIKRGMVYPQIFLNSFIFMPTVVVRKSCFDERGLFDETLKACEDLEMWLRITKVHAVDFADAPLAKYRFSTNQLHQNTIRVLHYRILVQERFFGNSAELRELDPRLLDRYYYDHYLQLARLYARAGRMSDARATLGRYLHQRGLTRSFVRTSLSVLRGPRS